MEKIRKFKQKLFEGEVTFSYKKKDGSVREARGTLNPEYLPKVEVEKLTLNENEEPKKKRTVAEDMICYYDLDKAGWRSFRFEQLIG